MYLIEVVLLAIWSGDLIARVSDSRDLVNEIPNPHGLRRQRHSIY